MVEHEPGAGLATCPLVELDVTVGPPVELGVVDGENARLIPITGGTVTGRLNGRILPGGADWQTIGPDGTLDIAARYVAEVEEGLVEIRSNGVRSAAPDVLARLSAGESVDAADYYFRTAIRFRTAAPALRHLNTMLAVSVGQRLPASVRLQVFEIG